MPLSDIFIFKEENIVLKIYKEDTSGFNFKNKNEYLNFVELDYKWNHLVSPGIYLNLVELEEKDNVLYFEPFDSKTSKNAIIVMNKIDEENSILNLFLNNKMEDRDFILLGIEFGRIKKETNNIELEKKIKYFNLYSKFMNELSVRIERMPRGFLGLILKSLKTYIFKNKKYFLDIKSYKFKKTIDCNIGNLIFSNEKLSIIDSYPPKEEWRCSSKELDYFRVGADIFFIFGKKRYELFMNALSSQVQIDKSHERFYLLYAGMISYPYFYHLGGKDKKYKKIVWKYQKNLKEYFFKEKLNN